MLCAQSGRFAFMGDPGRLIPRTEKPPHDNLCPSFALFHPLAPRGPLASSFATSYAGVVAFIAVVTEGSFARAADRLGIGRSAVSRSVQKLEDQLNVRLFLRTTRSTTLTREGDLFCANCHTGVDRIVQAVEEMRDLRQGPPRGHLRISAAVGFGRRSSRRCWASFARPTRRSPSTCC